MPERTPTTAPLPLEPRQRIALAPTDGTPVEVDVAEVAQRNWSRTALGARGDQQLFLKQFVGLDGSARPELMHDERFGVGVARECFGDSAFVPPLVGANESRVVLGYERVEAIPVDVALRDDPRVVEAAWPELVDALAHLVERLADPQVVRQCANLPAKVRAYASNGLAVNFKGLEVRNIAARDWGRSPSTRAPLILFDLGRPYLAPVEEVVARLVVSTLLLNWGSPLSRFRHGPPVRLADTLADRLVANLSSVAIRLELEREARARRVVSSFGSPARRLFKHVGMATVGTGYLRKAQRWSQERRFG